MPTLQPKLTEFDRSNYEILQNSTKVYSKTRVEMCFKCTTTVLYSSELHQMFSKKGPSSMV